MSRTIDGPRIEVTDVFHWLVKINIPFKMDHAGSNSVIISSAQVKDRGGCLSPALCPTPLARHTYQQARLTLGRW